MRFYPPEVPEFPREPRRGDFEIRQIDETVGEGVVALVPFAVGEVVFAFTGFIVDRPTKYTLQISPGVHLHDPFFMGKVLHHCEPNCNVDMTRRTFLATRAIRPGDRVTMDYDQTEDALHREFECRCGAAHCRKVISGRGSD